MKRIIAGITLALAGLGLVGVTVATSAQATGSDKVLVCHNIAHNPVLISVDDDSVKLQGHLAHRTHPENLDKVEGVDGNADAIRAFCADEVEVTVPGPTITKTVTLPPTTKTVEVPGPESTVTVTLPATTKTVELPGSTVTQTLPGPTTTAVVTGKAVVVKKTVAGATSTVTSTGEAVVVREAGKDTLAYTGMNAGILWTGVGLLAAGIGLTLMGRRAGQH